MGYALRHANHDFPMGEERFIIGRGESCHLCLDDPLASRNHAALWVQGRQLHVEDLRSRNGLFVNNERTKSSLVVSHGDVIRVGSVEMMVLERNADARAETLVQKPITERPESFGVLGTLADKALALGRGEEAERILGRQLDNLLEKAERSHPLRPEEQERCIAYALRIAILTQKGRWLDYLFRLHAAHERLMGAELVNSLYSLASKTSGTSAVHLRVYLETLKANLSSYDPGQRFVLKRVEGLEAFLS